MGLRWRGRREQCRGVRAAVAQQNRRELRTETHLHRSRRRLLPQGARNMSRPFSLRFRLTVWYSFALGVRLALFAVAIWLSMRQTLRRDVDQTLLDDAQSLERFSNQEFSEAGVNLAEELDEYFHAYPRDTLLSIRNRSGSIRYVSAEPFPFSSDSSRGRVLNTEQWNQRSY